jgi:hypothetical protein
MAPKARSPFAGFPAASLSYDPSGGPVFHVEPRILTPLRAVVLRHASDLAIFAGIGGGLWAAFSAENPNVWMFAAAVIIPIALERAIRKTLESFIRKRVRLRLTLDRFSIEKWYGWRHFDRQLPHRFAVLPHDWMQAEADMEELRQQEMQLKHQPTLRYRLYGESFHLSFDYLGQRNDLMTVYGQKDAVAVAMRLKACDDVLDALMQRGHGTPLDPGKEWSQQPGAIPEEV